jgi:hypothetical protein
VAFGSNIGETNVIMFPPFSQDKTQIVYNGITDIPKGSAPDPKKRYGYLLGPSVINTLTRSMEFKPQQQTNSNTPNTQTRALPERDKLGRFTKKAPAAPEVATSDTLKPTSAPVGPSNGRTTPGMGNKDNPDQVANQNALNDEKAAQLQMQTYLMPALMGIKPHDILYIPSFKGKYIEDWIVQSVNYDQNDGRVEIGIQATRVYGVGTPMNQKQADKFLEYARQKNLVGENWTLEAWDKYAWMVDTSVPALPTVPTPGAAERFFRPTLPSPVTSALLGGL